MSFEDLPGYFELYSEGLHTQETAIFHKYHHNWSCGGNRHPWAQEEIKGRLRSRVDSAFEQLEGKESNRACP